MVVAVMGARGKLGRLVVSHGLARGLTLRAVSPHMTPTGDPRVQGVAASDRDHDVLVDAFTNTDAVVIVFPASINDPHAYPDQLRRVFAAAGGAGVPRVIGLIGSAGALTSYGERLVDTDYFQETTRHFYQSVQAAWNVYRQADVDWVAFVPAARMQDHLPDRGTYRTRTDERLVTTDESSRR